VIGFVIAGRGFGAGLGAALCLVAVLAYARSSGVVMRSPCSGAPRRCRRATTPASEGTSLSFALTLALKLPE
jgi:hypothetical protein